MQIPEIIKTSLEYIENNLKTDITAEELARMANYSTFHYCRLFSSVMDSSVLGYILKCRLDHALSEIAYGKKAIDIVLEYGFDNYAGFYKAFIKVYGCSPKKYLSIYHHHKPIKPEVANMYTERELRKILESWDIEKTLPIRGMHIMDGAKISSNTWTVGGDFILKTGNREKLMKNLKVTKALLRQDLASSLPVSTKAGSEYMDGKEIFILTHVLKGSPLPKSDRYGENRADFGEKYGRSIARLHKALKEAQKEVLPDEVDLYKSVTDWALPNVRQQNIQWDIGLDEKFFKDYVDTFGRLYAKLPKQLIHRDPNPGNILFDEGEVSRFIDFDLSEINIRLWDACYCATGILSESSDEMYEKWLDILSGILHGYNNECKLTLEEKQAVFYVITSIQMICVAYFEGREEYKQLAKTNRKVLMHIVNNKAQIDQIF
ncbi:transposon Tn10 TetD protein [Oxobacter pfennigii]|uniref:Transposon Tn10 TetD protein n=1 Tax=Oxobacter pfennigii TaxID=36849 RepID=A0A0N8NSQ6_9CLOT|nr:helix-turn-helix domain-containing protein [Oxobacter pfennigii]KPU42696.1 transposon Tn10 TetD protein [Oxobacter pfennigii]